MSLLHRCDPSPVLQPCPPRCARSTAREVARPSSSLLVQLEPCFRMVPLSSGKPNSFLRRRILVWGRGSRGIGSQTPAGQQQHNESVQCASAPSCTLLLEAICRPREVRLQHKQLIRIYNPVWEILLCSLPASNSPETFFQATAVKPDEDDVSGALEITVGITAVSL